MVESKLTKTVLGSQDTGPREARLLLRSPPRSICLASCYAPQSGGPLDDREHFFVSLLSP
eukprot:10443400-Alexandrium_andersonii.AAC.1